MFGRVLFGQSKRLPVQEKIPGRTAFLFEGGGDIRSFMSSCNGMYQRIRNR